MDRRAVAGRFHNHRRAERELRDHIPVLEVELEHLKQQNQDDEQRLQDAFRNFEERKMRVTQDIDENHRQELDELRKNRETAEEQLRLATDVYRHDDPAIRPATRASRKSRAKHQYDIADSRFKARQVEVEIEKAEAVREVFEEFRRAIN